MRRLKTWIAWHFGSIAQERITMAWQRIEALERKNSEMAAALLAQRKEAHDLISVVGALVSEVNGMRDRPTPAAVPLQNARRARNWGEFRAAAENPRPIEVRTT